MYLITGAAGGVGGVSRQVVEALLARGEPVRAMVRRDDDRAAALRELGAQVVIGDLTRAADIAAALPGVRRMFFNMSVSPDYLRATVEVAAVAVDRGELEALVNISQMTVSQMTLTGEGESQQHRLHWLAEHVLDWSGLPVIHVRPTIFLENPLLSVVGARSVKERDVLTLPFGGGRTSPIATADVARVVAALLQDPMTWIGYVFDLTGPQALDIGQLAEQFSRALQRPITAQDMPVEQFQQVLTAVGLPDHVRQHIETMAALHRAGRYDRWTDDVERLTGRPAQSVEQYVAAHPELFS